MCSTSDESGLTILEAALGALAMLSLLLASIDGYTAFRVVALLRDAAVESAESYANADQTLGGATKISYSADQGYELLQKTIPPTQKSCSGESWCSTITLTTLPLGSPNPTQVEVAVQYEVPLMILGSNPIQLSRTFTKRLENAYLNNKTASYINSNVCGSYGGSCVW